MNSNTDLKELWSRQTIEPPKIEEFLSTLRRTKRKKLITLIAVNVLMAATIAFITYIWIHFQPELISTKIGIILMIIGILVYVIAYNKQFPFLQKDHENQSNRDFLSELIKFREKQKLLQTKMLNLYFIILTAGLSLYLYEYIRRMQFTSSAIVCLCTLTWLGFNWFYLRPRVIHKQQKKLNEIIKNFKNLYQQS